MNAQMLFFVRLSASLAGVGIALTTCAGSLRLAPATVQADNRVRFTASTPDLDRHGTRLMPMGCDSAAFERNPVVLWNHNKDGSPDDVLGRVVEIVKTAAAVEVVVEFDTHAKAQEVLRKVRAGFLRAVSVSFIPQQDQQNSDGTIDVLKWELCELSIVPVPSNRQALKRGYSLRVTRTFPTKPLNSRGVQTTMNITEKLGLPADATPEQVAEKLIEFLSGGASTEDKMALILGMLTPSASSASDGGKDAALEAVTEESKRLAARVEELEKALGEKTKAAEEQSAEQRADAACNAGQWPMAQRNALVAALKAGQRPYLFPAKTFSSRSVAYTPAAAPQRTQPNFGDAGDAKQVNQIEADILNAAKRAGLSLTAESFAAAKAKNK